MNPVRFASAVAMVAILAALAGCSDGGGVLGVLQGGGAAAACAAPYVTVEPDPVVAGEPAKVTVINLSETCHDQGEGPDVPATGVTVRLEAVDGSWGPTDIATLDAGEDFTATSAFQLPGDTAPGTVLVALDGNDTGSVFEVVAP